MQIVGTAGTLPTTCGKEKNHSQFFAAVATGRLAILNDPDNDDNKNDDLKNGDAKKTKKKTSQKPCKRMQMVENVPKTIQKCSEIDPMMVWMAEQKVVFIFFSQG